MHQLLDVLVLKTECKNLEFVVKNNSTFRFTLSFFSIAIT